MEAITTTKEKTYYGKYFQQGKDFLKAKGEPVPHGIRNATVKSSSDSFTAPEPMGKGSRIFIGKIASGGLPAFCLIRSTGDIAGEIGTNQNPAMFGCFVIQAGLNITLLSEVTEPLVLGGDVFIKLAADFAAGEKIKVRLFYT